MKYLVLAGLVKETDYDRKINEIEKKLTDHNHDKYITTPEFNSLGASVFNARLALANLITKTDFDANLSSLNRKFTSNKSKHLLVENELKKLKTFDSSYFVGKSHFEEDGIQQFSQCTDILNELLVLVTAFTFITGNLKMKEIILLQRLILLLHSQIILALKQEQNLVEVV